MKEELEFREKLSGILTMAREKDSSITVDEVACYFKEDALSDEQMELVYEYLLSQKITVRGYVKMGNPDEVAEEEEEKIHLTEEEQQYLKEYMEELKAVGDVATEEKSQLFAQAASGDALSKSKLVEAYLPIVVDVAKEMYHPEVFLGDLVQEGNVGLLLAVEQITDADGAHDLIVKSIRMMMQGLIEEQTELKNRDRRMVEKVNELDESIQSLTEELGRKVTLEELAVYTGMSEEEVEDILRLAGEDTDEEEEEA